MMIPFNYTMIALLFLINIYNAQAFTKISSMMQRHASTRPYQSFVRASTKPEGKVEKLIDIKKDVGLSNNTESPQPEKLLPILAVGVVLAAVYYVSSHSGVNINQLFTEALDKIQDLGPLGYLYFAAFYITAEVLAIPAAPLTASSGYLFGLVPGFLTVLTSATIAATISFYIGRTFLREWALSIATSKTSLPFDVCRDI
jgi:hypothetical protein